MAHDKIPTKPPRFKEGDAIPSMSLIEAVEIQNKWREVLLKKLKYIKDVKEIV